MADECDNIEQQIDETKASLIGKLDALETQVAGVVQATSESVSETVGAVKDTVNTVKEKVRDAGEYLNLRRQAENNPWTVFGSSVVAGCVAGYLFCGRTSTRGQRPRSTVEDSIEPSRPQSVAAVRPEPRAESAEEKHSWLREQLGNLSGLAIGALMGSLRDLAASNMPDGLGKSISQEMDRFTTSLGATPISGPILPRLEEWLAPESKAAGEPPPKPSAAPSPRWPAASAKQPAV